MKRKFSILIFTLLFFSVTGCRSTRVAHNRNTADSLKEDLFVFYDDGNSPKINDTDSYVFFRLYNPKYIKPSVGAVLQSCLNSVDTNEFTGSHISIGFDLSDNFYGLTLWARPNFKIEQCTNLSTNEYMVTCDERYSLQTTFAMKVTQSEYNNLKTFVEKLSERDCLKYDSGKNFEIAFDTVYRLSSKGNRSGRTYRQRIKRIKNNKGEFNFDRKYKFVCSTALGFILDKTVANVHDYFIENDIDYNFLLPTDFAKMDGMQVLFTSSLLM